MARQNRRGGMRMNEGQLNNRRDFLRRVVDAAVLVCVAGYARAGAPRRMPTDDAFALALRREVGLAKIESTSLLSFTIPSVAEDGAVVPVSLESQIAQTDRLLLFAEKNPFPLLVAFDFAAPAVPFVTLRVKLNATGRVAALARANGRYYLTERPVRVVVGGCG
jgi:sulfur-oxidizing protein SoxY